MADAQSLLAPEELAWNGATKSVVSKIHRRISVGYSIFADGVLSLLSKSFRS